MQVLYIIAYVLSTHKSLQYILKYEVNVIQIAEKECMI